MTKQEAIERIKARFDKLALDNEDTEAIQTLIPELHESEDEKIRKEMIEFFNQFKEDGLRGVDITPWIAYLEKQKESLHIPETCKENADSFTGGIIEVRSFQRGIEEGRRREKQKEQTSDIILKAFENSKTDYSLEEREEASDYSEKVLPTSIACGESDEEFLLHKVIEAAYIAGQKEQRPPIAGNDFGWIDELKHDLKHPEELDEKVQEVLKKRQKPVERSLEDDHIIGFVYDLLNEIEWKDNWAMSKKECLERLKPLRPSWKPSKEQMRVLSWAANGMVDKSIAAPEMRAVLRELYEQLKAL